MHLKKFSPSAQKVLIQCRALAEKIHNILVEPEHLALALLMTAELTELLGKKSAEHKELETALLKLISNFPVGVITDPHFSSRLIQALSSADALSISKGHENIFVSDLFLSLLENRDKYGALGGVFAKYFLGADETLREQQQSIKEDKNQLFPLGDNINHLIKTEQLDPVIGRDEEVDRVIQILARKGRNNPILIGEPGVGRTSIIYSLVKRIVEQKIPSHLISKEIVSFDVSALISGTTLRGQFEERIQKLMSDLAEHQGQYILFVRDLSMLMGAGGDGGSNAANLLKPSLARGIIQLIGLVTPDVYKKRIETDPSFERYFQPIWINQPETEECHQILLGLRDKYEQFHGVFIDDEALRAAIELGARNLTGGVLPELALDVLDEACSRHRVIMDQKPKVLTDLADRIIKLEMDLVGLPREKKSKKETVLNKTRSTLKQMTETYEKERSIIASTMRAIKGEIAQLTSAISKEKSKGDIKKAANYAHKNVTDLRLKFLASQKELSLIKKSERLIDPWVKRDDIAQVISQQTGIPVQRMLQSERAKLADMEEWLSTSVIGQTQAITAVANAIRRARAGLKDPKKPIGSFLFLGPTGVGKTELARCLTRFLFDDERAMVRFDMSEFMERHSVARLIGAPPGYHGSDEGGQLTEKIRRKPYSVILFDEIEKAHSDVLNVLLQVLDEGRLTDSSGHLVQFSNTVIIMTSNIGADLMLLKDPTDDARLREQIMERLLGYLRPELINRIDEIVIFNAIDREGIIGIADLMLKHVIDRLLHEGIKLTVAQEVKNILVTEGYSREYGARPLKRTIQRLIENPLAMALVKGCFVKGDAIEARLGSDGEIEFKKLA